MLRRKSRRPRIYRSRCATRQNGHFTPYARYVVLKLCVGGMYMYEWYVDVYVRTYVGCTPRGRAYGHRKTTFMWGMIFRNTLIV